MERFWLSFIPLFVAFDAIGLVPIYWSLAHRLPSDERRLAVHQAVLVAFIVTLAFLWLSGLVFEAMGLQMSDLLIAGGIILFVLSLNELLHPEKTQYAEAESIGAVPLGVPLMAGPAVLATALLLRERYGLWPTVGALAANTLVMWATLQVAERVMARLGQRGAMVVSKVFSLVLAAFAVMLVREGLTLMWPEISS